MTGIPDSADTGSKGARKVAIALEYDQARDRAPRVIASGAGAVAEQILEIAFAQGVQVREDADLVQVLGALDVDSIIPTEVLAAVAEILSYVYRVNREALLREMQS
ncbi:MAG: EscU/YscU/HrcU family type III secretion system export apparatus switch protein [Proteobacteria bacterium]|nr:EscU/YscU/HrcU family type III secretion system export apparatus switch protein [Pseudomonadota bacterium]MCH8187598.1 EscU/YscU/HrcU family type III secretion system export apparatus switch protein [Pseudomonadota bacterium]